MTMHSPSRTSEVRLGQIWEDCDKRQHGRRLAVKDVDETHAYLGAPNGRVTKVRLDRMRPTSTGFRLVFDPHVKQCPTCGGAGQVDV